MAMSHQTHNYTELRQQIHDDLRAQHPEWVEPNGECPICDSYASRLMELLDTFTRSGSDESVADIHRALEQGLNWIDRDGERHAQLRTSARDRRGTQISDWEFVFCS
jgi:hypothetical protein